MRGKGPASGGNTIAGTMVDPVTLKVKREILSAPICRHQEDGKNPGLTREG